MAEDQPSEASRLQDARQSIKQSVRDAALKNGLFFSGLARCVGAQAGCPSH